MTSDDKTCTIRFDGHGYYLGFGPTRSRQNYKTFAGALRAACRKGYAVLNTQDPKVEYLANEGKTKIVTNLISGKLVRIAVNTPHYCDPSTETYWSS